MKKQGLKMKNKKIVYFVHCIDTEGPLYESLDAKFQRVKDIFNINIKKSASNLSKLKNEKIKLDGKEKKIASILSSHLTNYNSNWEQIEKMTNRIFSLNFRKLFVDSFNKPWVFNWHCLDHVGYKKNPRRRTLGYHKIFDYYNGVIKKFSKYNYEDKIHWHFHPMSTFNDAHRCATSYNNSPELYKILCKKIIERKYFPSVFRAGFQAERPDSNLFLEQWIPFDMTNMSMKNNKDLDLSLDFKNGRSGNWRNAPTEWSIYHPHHDDYQKKGNCRRWIGRALNVMNRICSINQKEINDAFLHAEKKGYAIVGFASHDFRNLETEVNFLHKMIVKSSKKHQKVKYKFCEAQSAFKSIVEKIEKTKIKPIKLKVKFYKKTRLDFPKLDISTDQGEVFGPQPFLAIQTKDNIFYNDNLDFSSKKGLWHYAFHSDTINIENIKSIGIAANDKLGNTFVKRFKIVKNIKIEAF